MYEVGCNMEEWKYYKVKILKMLCGFKIKSAQNNIKKNT